MSEHRLACGDPMTVGGKIREVEEQRLVEVIQCDDSICELERDGRTVRQR
jgi:hypothetical protein